MFWIKTDNNSITINVEKENSSSWEDFIANNF